MTSAQGSPADARSAPRGEEPPPRGLPWLVSIHKFDQPESPTWMNIVAAERSAAWLALWHRHIGPTTPRAGADFEDFWEQAARLDAALAAFPAATTWITTDHLTAANVLTAESRPVTALGEVRSYGAQPSLQHHQDNPSPQERLASNYMRYRTFARHAGRRIHLCAHEPGPAGLVGTLERWHADGMRRFVVKARPTKYGVYDLDVTDRSVREAITGNADLAWATVHLEGQPGAFLAQQWVPMTYEYRIFIVGQRPVTGAGCIESMTPLANSSAFDTRMAAARGRSLIETLPAAASQFEDFAWEFAVELAAERPDLTDYVLDLAFGPNGKPLVIELNGLLNSGLYASQPRLVTFAMNAQDSR